MVNDDEIERLRRNIWKSTTVGVVEVFPRFGVRIAAVEGLEIRGHNVVLICRSRKVVREPAGGKGGSSFGVNELCSAYGGNEAKRQISRRFSWNGEYEFDLRA